MTTEPVRRKLAAILYADAVAYSRLTRVDENGAHNQLGTDLDLIAETVEGHDGHVVHYAGDAVLAEFGAVVDAVSCAVDIQKEIVHRNEDLPELEADRPFRDSGDLEHYLEGLRLAGLPE